MQFTDLKRLMDSDFGNILPALGFSHVHPGMWTRYRGVEINMIQLQKQSEAPLFCVNLGVHFSFLPIAGTATPVDPTTINVVDCEVKLRLTEHAADKDQWWPIAASSVEPVTRLLQTRGMAAFEAYRIDGAISRLSAASVVAGSDSILAGMTKVRACLLLARVHEHLKNRTQCIEAAELGLKVAGMAVGPKVELKAIIGRVESLS